MALKLDDPDSKIDQGYDSGSGAYNPVQLSDAENTAFDDIANNYDKPANKSVEDQENTPSKTMPDPWKNNVNGSDKKQKVNFMSRLSGKKKWLAGGGVGAGLVSIPLIFMSLLPLKMEMFIKNITNLASTVPAYATEQRLDYLITRALATRLLMAANGIDDVDGKLVFCGKSNVISCSLFATYTNDYFDKKLGIKIDVNSVNGRTTLGGRATSWEIGLDKGEGGDDINTPLSKIITKNSEMKALIRSEVHSKTKKNQIITRFLARKILMKKYGVTTWRGPPKLEKAANNLVEAKSNVNSNIIKNTVGKISPRVATYLTCLQGEVDTCTKLRDKLSADIVEVKDPAEDPAWQDKEGTAEYAEQQKLFEKYKVNKSLISGVADTTADAAAKSTSKFISKKVIAVAGGATAIVGVLDLVFNIVNSIGDGGGALEEVGADMATQVYTGLAVEVQTTNDKMKAGDLDIDTIAATTALFDGAETSPLQQAESGLAVDTSNGITTQCNGTTDGEKVNVKLAPNQLVCPEQQVVRNYSSWTENIPGWSEITVAAKAWVDGVAGRTMAAIGEIGSAIMGPILGPVMKPLTALFGDKIETALTWVSNKIFDPPAVGTTESGPDNYAGTSAGIRITQDALMQEGVDENGTAMGGGGTVLSPGQLLAVTEESKKTESQYFENQPLMARIFSLDLSGSFIQQFTSRIPTSVSSLARLPITSFSQLMSGTLTNAASSSNTINPFNLPMYGYAAGDPALTADPSVYDEVSCSASAAARLESKKKTDISLISVYTVADPCALEKMVVGSALNSEGVTDDQYSLKNPTINATTAPTATSVATGSVDQASLYVDSTSVDCAAGTTDAGVETGYSSGKSVPIRLCSIPNTTDGMNSNQPMRVNSRVSGAYLALTTAMGQALKKSPLHVSDSFRTMSGQQAMLVRYGSPRAAQPGYSNHQMGLAIDFQLSTGNSGETKTPGRDAVYDWLKANAATYGIKQYTKEAWHWQPTGVK